VRAEPPRPERSPKGNDVALKSFQRLQESRDEMVAPPSAWPEIGAETSLRLRPSRNCRRQWLARATSERILRSRPYAIFMRLTVDLSRTFMRSHPFIAALE
jgi:hypothetical protein